MSYHNLRVVWSNYDVWYTTVSVIDWQRIIVYVPSPKHTFTAWWSYSFKIKSNWSRRRQSCIWNVCTYGGRIFYSDFMSHKVLTCYATLRFHYNNNYFWLIYMKPWTDSRFHHSFLVGTNFEEKNFGEHMGTAEKTIAFYHRLSYSINLNQGLIFFQY